MAGEMKLAPGAVNFVPGLVDAEVFAGRLRAGATPVHLTGGVASGWKCRAVEGALGSFHVYERIEGKVRCVVDARLVQASVLSPDRYLQREWEIALRSSKDQNMEETIFEACQATAELSLDDFRHGIVDRTDAKREAAVSVIQAIIDRTPSPATVVELTRILREGGVDVPEATFD